MNIPENSTDIQIFSLFISHDTKMAIAKIVVRTIKYFNP